MESLDKYIAGSRHKRTKTILSKQYYYMQKLKLLKQYSEAVNSINSCRKNALGKLTKYVLYHKFRLLPFICHYHQDHRHLSSSPREQNENNPND